MLGRKNSFKQEHSLPGYCDAVWEFEALPEDSFIIYRLQTYFVHRVTITFLYKHFTVLL